MAELTVPQVNFGVLGDLMNTYRDARIQSARRDALSNSAGNPQAALQALMKAGDVQGASVLAHIVQSQGSQDLQRQQFENTKYTQSPGYIEQSARTRARVEQEFSPKTTNIKTPSGEEITVEKGPGGYRVPQVEGVSGTPNNPYATGGKMNEAQSKDALYAGRMFASEKVLREVEQEGTKVWERIKGGASNRVGINFRGADYQKFDQAQRDFINATLRRESGAVISPAEFENATKQYFPAPGDTADVIKQKRANRAEAIRGIAAGAGPSWRPDSVFDQGGNIVANPAPQRQGAAGPPAAAPAAAQSGGPVRVNSPAERDALSPGTQYIAPDGSLRTKQ